MVAQGNGKFGLRLTPESLQTKKQMHLGSSHESPIFFSDFVFQAIQLTSQAVSEGLLQPEDISEALLERCLYTQMSSKVDLLIRTSGEVRLSDFLLWQSSFSVIYFTDILWPDFSVRNLMAGIFYYQRHRRQIGILEEEPSWKSDLGAQADFLNKESAERISRFLHKLDHELWAGKKITISKKLPTAEDQTNTMQQKKS